MWRTYSLEKTLMLGKFEGRKRRGWQRIDGWMTSPTWWTQVWASSRSWWWTGKTNVLQSVESQRAGRDWVTELNIIYKTGALGRIWPKQTPSKALGCDSRKEKKKAMEGRESIEGVKERLPSGQLGTVPWTHLREVQESLLERRVLLPFPHQTH